MKRTLFVVVLGCLLTIFGCINAAVKTDQEVGKKDAQVSGKYVHARAPEIYIELRDDGTYCHIFGKRIKCGKYIIDGNRIIFDSETKFELEVKGNSLISKEGVKYIKQ